MENQDNIRPGDVQSPPNNNMTLAIVGTILGLCSPCCLGFFAGIAAIIMSTQVNSKFNTGDYAGAETSAKNARTWAYVAIVLGVLGVIFNAVYFMVVGSEGYTEMIESYQRQLGQ
ncbi:MAG: CD225/dispanin family protein [Moheibacter sp.]